MITRTDSRLEHVYLEDFSGRDFKQRFRVPACTPRTHRDVILTKVSDDPIKARLISCPGHLLAHFCCVGT
jgi:hypothetical protein